MNREFLQCETPNKLFAYRLQRDPYCSVSELAVGDADSDLIGDGWNLFDPISEFKAGPVSVSML